MKEEKKYQWRRVKEGKKESCDSLVQWEHCCSRTNWESARAMGGSASELLSSAWAGGQLCEVKLAKIYLYGNPWSLTRWSFEGFSGQAGGKYKKNQALIKKCFNIWIHLPKLMTYNLRNICEYSIAPIKSTAFSFLSLRINFHFCWFSVDWNKK